ncbi:MAG TPA: hypothetical protein DCQ68_07375 [Chryseobacterium indologenes]|nr:hypothetical protein [Chryseobacterium indologenes]
MTNYLSFVITKPPRVKYILDRSNFQNGSLLLTTANVLSSISNSRTKQQTSALGTYKYLFLF